MNLAHVHLLLNHVPTVGFGIGLGLLVLSLVAGSHDDLKRASLIVLFVVAILTIPTFLSGTAAEAVLRGTGADSAFPPGVLPSAIRRHEDAALLALVFMEITGGFAWLALWQWRGRARLPQWNLSVVLLLSIVTFGLMARASTMGGDISHPEIRAVQEVVGTQGPTAGADAAAQRCRERPVRLAHTSPTTPGLWPTAESLHFIGLSLLFTVVLVVDLRLLGVAKRIPYSAVSQLLPLGMLGFGVNLITGMLFFLALPRQYTGNIMFLWKVMLIVIAGVNDLYLMLCPESWAAGSGRRRAAERQDLRRVRYPPMDRRVVLAATCCRSSATPSSGFPFGWSDQCPSGSRSALSSSPRCSPLASSHTSSIGSITSDSQHPGEIPCRFATLAKEAMGAVQRTSSSIDRPSTMSISARPDGVTSSTARSV